MNYDGWRTNDEPVQPENEYANGMGFWTSFRFAQQNGYGREFLDTARKFRTTCEQTLREADAALLVEK